MIVGGFSLLAKIPEKPATPAQTRAAVPAYCQDKAATYRLPECGVSAQQQRELDMAPEKAAADRAAANRWLVEKLTAHCDKPIGKMSPDEFAECSSPGMRRLRDQ